MYHDPHGEDGGSSKENRMIFTESMPRRVGSFYRGKKQEPPNHELCVVLHFETIRQETKERQGSIKNPQKNTIGDKNKHRWNKTE